MPQEHVSHCRRHPSAGPRAVHRRPRIRRADNDACSSASAIAWSALRSEMGQSLRIETPQRAGNVRFTSNSDLTDAVPRAAAWRQKATFAVEQIYSITSSARASNVGEISRPSPLAVLRLMTRSNLVGCSTGSSAGFAPRRILST
jgi:hypothetical protein